MSDTTERHRLLPDSIYLRLKAEWRRLCSALGGYAGASQVTRGATASLHRHGDALRPDLYPAVDMVLDLETTLGRPLITGLLASLQGYRLVPADVFHPRTDATPEGQALAVMREVGEYAGAVAEMDSDGVRTVTELRRAIKEGEEAKEAIEISLDTLYRELAAAMAPAAGPVRGGCGMIPGDRTDSAAGEGRRARRDGLPRSANPYLPDTESGYAWEMGWRDEDAAGHPSTGRAD